jgi:hypothetical protein
VQKLEEDWEFGVLGIYDFRKPGQFAGYYRFLIENHDRVEGDIAEVGVFRGSSLLATAMLLKELGSKKLVWGFDSFSGFPGYAEQDQLPVFTRLRAEGKISASHLAKVERNIELRRITSGKAVDVANVSTSGDFSQNPLSVLEKKIAFLGLDNIRLVKGDFAKTMVDGAPPTAAGDASSGPSKLCAALIDCDLYDGYRVSLPYTWQRLSRGGYMFLDEYYSLKFPGARLATDEFFADKADKPQQHQGNPGEFERWFVRRLFG